MIPTVFDFLCSLNSKPTVVSTRHSHGVILNDNPLFCSRGKLIRHYSQNNVRRLSSGFATVIEWGRRLSNRDGEWTPHRNSCCTLERLGVTEVNFLLLLIMEGTSPGLL